jgi:hypothetical protein
MRSIKIDEIFAKDLELMQSILDKAKKGIDMNLLAFRSPDRIYYSDSCPAGLGGYSDQGFAWQFAIPDDLLFQFARIPRSGDHPLDRHFERPPHCWGLRHQHDR